MLGSGTEKLQRKSLNPYHSKTKPSALYSYRGAATASSGPGLWGGEAKPLQRQEEVADQKAATRECADSIQESSVSDGYLAGRIPGCDTLLLHLKYDAMYKHWALTFISNKFTARPTCRMVAEGYC